ncbi:MAG: hypothetical protein B7Z35_01360 [Hydrogenophilales bacterium 12-61-10]|nr:MAG: hypothetical protein B7Z35_01360 [Hydrogenophilales bacterium 12-61-10]OYX31678.1 MAG: hypothetical protein B7Z03_03820 [Hydrogenophilales bacterium 32-62-9]
MSRRLPLALFTLLAALTAGTVQAQTLEARQPPGNESLFAINDKGELLGFRAGNPRKILTRKKVVGLDEKVRGIDFRVSHGVLFVLGASGRFYTLNTANAQASPVGEMPLTLPAIETGFDFNPTVDRMRVALADGSNLRAHPVSGAQVDFDPKADGVQRDGALVYAPGDAHAGWPALVNGVAYTYNQKDAKLTTNFAIDGARGALVTMGSREGVEPAVSPNSGQVFSVGSLKTGPVTAVSFDISDVNNCAYLAASRAGDSRTHLYRVNLDTGEATWLSSIGKQERIQGMAIEP